MDAPNLGNSASEFREFLGVIWRYRWLVIISVVVITAAAVGSSVFLSTPKYQASTDLLQRNTGINQAIVGSDIFGASSDTPERRLDTAIELVKSPDVLQAVTTAVGSDRIGNRSLEDMLNVSLVGQTDVFRITVIDRDPQLAADLANAFATSYISWRQQVDRNAIEQARQPIEAQLNAIPADQRDSGNYKSLSDKLESLKLVESMQTTDEEIVKKAVANSSPVSPRPVRTGAFALAVSLVIGIGAVFTVDKLDTRVRSVDEITRRIDKPILASVPKLPSGESMVTLEYPASPAAEAFRLLKTNMGYAKPDKQIKSIMVTSAEPSEGKSTTIANLAVTLARAGQRVIVLEGDLRRPRLSEYLQLENRMGLTNAIAGNASLRESLQMIEAKDLAIAVESLGDELRDLPAASMNGVKPIYCATSGPLPPNPGELAASEKFGALINEACEYADIVLVDVPPVGAVGDAVSLAGKIDGIIVVIKLGQTSKKSLRLMHDFIETVPSNVLGLVVTNADTAGKYGGSYDYYNSYGY
ncbi:MAG: tyrosine-protein kinase domain-containing protein [Thermoleophilia bacterium]